MPAPCTSVRLLLLLSLMAGGPLAAGESATKPAAPAGKDAPAESPLLRETRQYVAQLTEQRNQLREENESLRGRQGLLLIYGAALTLLSGWLILRSLKRPAGKAAEAATDVFPAGTTVTVRKNATITIRNGSTQQPEMTEQVQTRRAFARGDTATQARQPATRREARTATTPTPAPSAAVVAPELDPTTPAAPLTTRRHAAARTNAPQQPGTVRVEQQSDRLAPVEIAVKPGTAPMRRVAADT